MAFPYAVTKRRKLGRIGHEQLKRIQWAIINAHCHRIPAANPMGYLPQWDTEEDRRACVLVGDLQRKVETNEAYATHPTNNRWPY
jgi:hypothetical protein